MRLAETQLGRLRKSDIEIANEFAGASLTEVMSERGNYILSPSMPYTPGYEFFGTVIKVGSAVKRIKAGDTVCGISQNSGCYSNRIHVNQKNAVIVSGGSKKAQEIAASVINYVTAMELLKSILEEPSEKSVFIRGAAGGVGLAVLDICRSKGIQVYGSVSANKRHMLEGKDAIFIDRTKELKGQRSLFPPKGVDLVLDQQRYTLSLNFLHFYNRVIVSVRAPSYSRKVDIIYSTIFNIGFMF